MRRQQIFTLLICVFINFFAAAQFPYSESFKGSTVTGLVVGGSAKLTAASGIDAVGSGYLRLTDNINNQVGYVYAEDSFPSKLGLSITFSFFTYKAGATANNIADGFSFFLFDASVNSFRPGGFGGSLGYAQKTPNPGMAKGYIGIGVDEFGNFSVNSDGKNGVATKQQSSVVIRGPGNGTASATEYIYKTGVKTDEAPHNSTFLGFSQRYTDTTNTNYRRLKLVLTPGSSLGTEGYRITVIMYKGSGLPNTPVVPDMLIENYDYPYIAPAKFQFGLAGSTGSVNCFHEIRDLSINAVNATLPPTLNNDSVNIICQGQTAIMDIVSNDVCNNPGGAIDKKTIDLDPSIAGIQTTYTDAGKILYSVDEEGTVTAAPVTGFVGASAITYTVKDTYGSAAVITGKISVTVYGNPAPVLSIANPPAVCTPAFVNISDAAWKTATSPGASYSYFATLNNANANTNNINSTASTITATGTYYIRAFLNGCPNIKPIIASISQKPSTAVAGNNQNLCGSATSASFLATNPDVGAGTWTQVSGPGTATIVFPLSAATTVQALVLGTYQFAWTVSNGACPASMSLIQVANYATPTTAIAGNNFTTCNAITDTLRGNTPVIGTGLWTQVGTPLATIKTPASAQTAIDGLIPGNAYTFKWTITNGTCTNNTSVIATNLINTIAAAGTNRTMCNVSNYTLQGNTPGTGNTGVWTQTAGPAATITLANSPGSTVTSLVANASYEFTWTISNSTCSNASKVLITILAPPSTATVTTSSASTCNQTTYTLVGNIPTSGVGKWTQTGGPAATILQPNNATTAVSGITSDNTYIFIWSIGNGICDSSTATVTIIAVNNTVANAGSNQVVAGSTFTLQGNTPGLGNNGLWSMTETPIGGSANITAPANPNSTVDAVTKNGDYKFEWKITNGTCNNAASVVYTVGSILPIDFLYFNVQSADTYNLLKWKTTSDKRNSHFVVERSLNGTTFSAIANVAANNSMLQEYNCKDSDIDKPGVAILYYRIKQLDANGQATYSKVVTGAVKKISDLITALPNPFKTHVYVSIVATRAGTAKVALYNSTGQLVASMQAQLMIGNNRVMLRNLQALATGMYFLQIETNTGGTTLKLYNAN